MNSSGSLAAQKALLRNKLRQRLRTLNPEDRARRSEEILKRLLIHPKFIGARRLLAYTALPTEVQTRPFLEEARGKGKRVYVPYLNREKKEILMMEFKNYDALKPGAYGILEPVWDPKKVGNPEDLDLAIVPGLGFDREGGRLGRGEGYFDRFLKKAQKAYKIGLAFECQIIERIPRRPNDITMDEVLIG